MNREQRLLEIKDRFGVDGYSTEDVTWVINELETEKQLTWKLAETLRLAKPRWVFAPESTVCLQVLHEYDQRHNCEKINESLVT